MITALVSQAVNKVIAISPLSYMQELDPLPSSPDICSIELVVSYKSIFDRLVFSDENDNIYKDDDYKNAHRTHYLKEIKEDLAWYGLV